jgi:hypothetical protein
MAVLGSPTLEGNRETTRQPTPVSTSQTQGKSANVIATSEMAMDADLLKGIGATAAVAGVAIGVLVQVSRPLLYQRVLSSMSRTQAYLLLNKIVSGCLVVAVAGAMAWSIASSPTKDEAPTISRPSSVGCGSAVKNDVNDCGNVNITGQPGNDTPGDSGFDVTMPRKKN